MQLPSKAAGSRKQSRRKGKRNANAQQQIAVFYISFSLIYLQSWRRRREDRSSLPPKPLAYDWELNKRRRRLSLRARRATGDALSPRTPAADRERPAPGGAPAVSHTSQRKGRPALPQRLCRKLRLSPEALASDWRWLPTGRRTRSFSNAALARDSAADRGCPLTGDTRSLKNKSGRLDVESPSFPQTKGGRAFPKSLHPAHTGGLGQAARAPCGNPAGGLRGTG